MSQLTAARRNRLRRALLETLEQRALMAVDLGLDSGLAGYTATQTHTPLAQQLEYIQTSLNQQAADDAAAYLTSTLGGSGGDLASQPWFPLISQAYDQWSQANDLAFSVNTTDASLGSALAGEGEGLVAEGEAGGPRLLSVAPNSGEIFTFNSVNTLTEAPTELVFRFDGSSDISASTIQNGIRILEAGADDQLGTADDIIITDPKQAEHVTVKSLFGDNNRIVILRFADTLKDGLYRVEVLGTDIAATPNTTAGTAIRNAANLRLQTRLANTDRDVVDFKLELGAQVVAVVPQPVDRIGGVLTPRLDQIEVYFNDDDLYPSTVTTGSVTPNPSVVDPNFYQLVFTNDSVQPSDDQRFIPTSITYDPAANRATLTFASRIDQLAGTGTYRLRVGTNDVVTSVTNPPVVTTYNPSDAGGDKNSANTSIGTVSSGNPISIAINGQVVTVSNPLQLDYPGSNFEPGHRDIPNDEESHIATARLPYSGNGSAADPTSGITTAYFNFGENSQGVRRSYGINQAGQPVFTSITPEQKQRVREIFEFYSAYLGIDFVETEASGMTIVVGDLFPNGGISGGGTLGIASVNNLNGLAVLDGAQVWDNSLGQPTSGQSFFQTALHEIGHMLGFGHDSELPDGTVMRGTGPGSPLDAVYPGDQDIVHGQYMYRPDNRDVDMYKFVVPANVTGQVSLEIIAERAALSSNLDSHLTLFRENADGKLEVVATNDDYYSSDSFLKMPLGEGTYYVGVTASGNQDYNPGTNDTGGGGVSQGTYQLQFQFVPDVQSSIVDKSGTALDGDGDGHAGGNFNFWFRAAPPVDLAPVGTPKVVYVDKGYSGVQTGSAAQPYNNLQTAANAVSPGDIIRVVGSVGADGDLTTVADNPAYEIGRGGVGNAALSDGITFEVPQGVTMMIDAGAIFKLGGSRIVAGSRDAGIDNRFSSIQVLGTPQRDVLFTSYNDQTLGTDTNPLVTTPQPGDWGGIEIHNDVDRKEGRGDYERKGIFLNYISHADMKYGGGRITVATPSPTINPIHLSEARPTLLYNSISYSGDSAISADPDSFEETRFSEPRYQLAAQFRSDYTRVGPEIRGNHLTNNPINGMFIRVPTSAGNVLQTLGVQARLDDRDIVYVLGENLIISGTPGGSFLETLAPDVSLTQASVTSSSVTGNTVNYKITEVDRFGGESIPSNATPGVANTGPVVTADSVTNTFTSPAHGFANGNVVMISSSANVPLGLSSANRYYVVNATANTFQLANSPGGPVINFLDNGSGVLTALPDGILVGMRQVTANNASNVFTSVAHGFNNGDMVNLTSTLSVPVGMLSGTNYYVINAAADTFQLSRTLGGPAIDFSSDGTGSLSVQLSVQLKQLPQAFGDFVSRRLWRSDNGGPYRLVAELDRNTPNFVDAGQNLNIFLANPNATFGYRARTDARLQIDPGIILKSLNSRIEVGIGAQLLAEGTPENKIIFTSRFDDRYGAGGTFDTNNDGNTNPGAGNWGGIIARQMSSLSIDSALVTFAGGIASVPGGFAGFNPVEIHQSNARIANSIFENNGSGLGGNLDNSREGRGSHDAAVIFVRGAQPTIINNVIQHNAVNNTAAISVDANSMKAVSLQDQGRQTGPSDRLPGALGNNGPLVRGNRLVDNALNGMRIRGATLTTEAVWDDTDIVHVLQGTVTVPNFHTYGGLRLQSRVDESLVVKLGANAGITATGTPLDMEDRIGGSVQVIGTPGFPVVMTSIKDDSVGAGFDPTGRELLDTGNDGKTTPAAADAWRGIRLDQNSNDRNLDTTTEFESDQIQDVGVNDEPLTSQAVGSLASSLHGGDENLRLGFTIHGAVASPSDLDVYSFVGTAGSPVYFDLDRTDAALDSVVELIDVSGRIIAQSNNSLTESIAGTPGYINTSLIAPEKVQILDTDPFAPRNTHANVAAVDFQSINPNDAGLRVVLPGSTGTTNTYYVRVRSSNVGSGQSQSRLQDPSLLRAGLSEGGYRLQLRLQQEDEIAGSTVRYADIRYAVTGIEAIGLPGHSPLLGRTSTPQGGSIFVPADSTNVGNIDTSDRGSVSVGGSLSGARDVDYYQFSIGRNLTQGSANTHVATTFDIDYASDFGGPNTSMWVYRVTGSGLQLVLTGTDSNIADDRSAPTQGADLDNLSRGSFGALDSYIGTQELPAGDYVVAISNNSVIASQLRQFQAANPDTAQLTVGSDIRLEPLDSIQRISVDRFEGANQQETKASPKQVAFSGAANNVPWTLGDVTAYVVHRNPNDSNGSRLVLADGYTGAHEGNVSTFARVADAAMSPDGRLVAYQIPTGTQTDGNSGTLLLLDSTGALGTSSLGSSGIQTFTTETPNGNATVQQRTINGSQQGDGIQFNALSFYDANNTLQMYGVGSRGNGVSSFQGNNNAQTLGLVPYVNYNVSNIVYKLDPSTGAAINPNGVQDRTGNARTFGNHAGTQKVEFGRFLSGTAAGNYLDGGTVTGLSYVDNTLYAVSDKGELFSAAIGNGLNAFSGQINFDVLDAVGTKLGEMHGKPRTTVILDPQTNTPIAFTALTAGPRNVNNGAYADILFGMTADGTIYAFNTAGALQPVFPGANVKIKSNYAPLDRDNPSDSASPIVGFAFSPLDVNLWHVTNTQGNVAGHGRPQTFDDSRTSAQNGENSMYFGFEAYNNAGGHQTGDWDGIYDVTAYRNTYNLPGGAHGAFESDPVDLRGYSSTDLPTLYFNYFLNTQNSNSPLNDGDVQMQDAFRVYGAGDDGQWVLLVTNNSAKSGNYGDSNDEYDQAIHGYSDPYGRPIQPQEAYDTGDNNAPNAWRQARVNLSPFAGQKNVRLRFEFSTAGSTNSDDPVRGGVELTAIEASGLKDGDTFTVAATDIATRKAATFEFDLGLVLDLPGGASIVNGDAININGTSYTFSTSTSSGTNIFYTTAFTPAEVANAVRSKLQSVGFSVRTNTLRTNVLNVSGVGAPAGGVYSVSGLRASTIAGLPGVASGNYRVPVTQDMTASQIRDAVRTALAGALNAPGQTTNTGVWPVYGNTIRMFGHVVVDPGPLLMSDRIGDTFGNDLVRNVRAGLANSGSANSISDFSQSWFANQWAGYTVRIVAGTGVGQVRTVQSNSSSTLVTSNTWAITPDGTSVYSLERSGTSLASQSRQLQNNAFTGLFVDDLIIGLAERGEMVLNAPPVNVGTGNAQNQLLFSDNLQYEQNGYTIGGAQVNEIEAGRYQLEIRTSAEYGFDDAGGQTRMNLGALTSRSFDSNDRLTKTIGLNVNSAGAAAIADGATFTLSDGVNQVTYEFDVIQSAGDRATGVGSGNIRIALFASDSAQQVATKIRNAINSTTSQQIVAVSASIQGEMLSSPSSDQSPSGSTLILLHGPAAMSRSASLVVPNNTGLTLKTWGSDTVMGEDGGDTNRERDQGMIVISSSTISNSTQYGLTIDAAPRGNGAPTFPGAPMNYPTINTAGLAPGVVVMNNVLANNAQGGILVSGDPAQNNATTGQDVARPSTVARIVNNTIYGTHNGDTAIRANEGAAPAILNNIIANTATGIDATGTSSSLVIGANLYYNVPAAAQVVPASTPQSFALQSTNSPFINAAGGFFYPAPGSVAIDSSLEALAELASLTQVKSSIGLPPSPALAPDRDALGQRRVDDPTVNDSSGVGSNVFKDRGAVERADVTALQAVILQPQDNDSSNVDIDRNNTFIRIQSGLLDYFSILLVDGDGTGADQATVTEDAITLTENGRRLLPGVDYTFGYNANSRTIRLTPLAGIWRSDSVYEITMNNRDGIRVTSSAGSAFANNDKLTITLPDNTQKVLTFRNDATGAAIVPFAAGDSAYQVAVQLVAQINKLGSGLSAYLQGDGSLMVVGAKSVAVSNSASAVIKSVGAIRDLAANPLAANRPTSLTQFTIVMPDVQLDYGDAAGAGSFTVQTSNGARHALLPVDVQLLALGQLVDADNNGIPSASATGDDYDSQVDLGTLGSIGGATLGIGGPAVYSFPATASAGLYGQTISITAPGVDPGIDPVVKKQVYEFTPDGTVSTPGNVPVIVALGEPVADKFAKAVHNSVLTGKMVGIAAVASGNQVSLGGTPQHKFSASATPLIQRLGVGNVSLAIPNSVAAIADGQTFTITDGSGRSVVFEINDVSPAVPVTLPLAPRVAVDVALATATSDAIATAISQAINNQITLGRLNLQPSVASGSSVSILSDDEDGVSFGRLFNANSPAVPITVTSTGTGMLDAWIDWNADGDFDDVVPGQYDEHFIISQPVHAGTNTFNVQTPAGATIGFTTARFRLSTLGGLLPGGLAIGGEVEDHLIEVVDGMPPVPKNDQVYIREDSKPTGTASGATATTLVDATQNWAANQWAGQFVRITAGTGAGQVRAISGNTTNALTTAAWTTTPDATSVYQIEFASILANDIDPETGKASSATATTLTDTTQTWTAGQWIGRNVRIVSGTGAGQVRSITGNTADTLTTAGWTTVPDSTSQYSIEAVGGVASGTLTVLDLDPFTEGVQTVSSTANGTLRLNSDGTFSYTPFAEFNGNDLFIYRAIDSRLPSTVLGTVTVTVTAVNDAPKAFDKSATILEENSTASVVTPYILPGSFFWSDAYKHNKATSLGEQFGEQGQVLKLTSATLIDGAGNPITNPAVGTVSVDNDTFTFVPGPNYNSLVGGDVKILYTIQDNGFTTDVNLVDQPDYMTAKATFTIAITPVNDRPEFPAAYLTNLSTTTEEDLGVVTVPNFIAGVRPNPTTAYDEGSASGGTALQYENQTIIGYEVKAIVNGVADNKLFAVPPAIAPDGTLTYKLADNVNEILANAPTPGFPQILVEVVAVDSGASTAPNANKSLPITFTILPAALNDAPEFSFKAAPPVVTVSGDTAVVSVKEDAGLVTVPTFLENYRNGPVSALDEASQALDSITINLINPPVSPAAAFSVFPTIDKSTFDLKFQTAPEVNNQFVTGSFVFTVTLTDNGASGGKNVNSTTKTFTISVDPVNDRPEFTMPATTSTTEDAGLVTTPLISGIRPGPVLAIDEATGPAVVVENQTVSFTANPLNPSLFAVLPTITPTGTLAYQLAPDVNRILANAPTPGFPPILVEVVATDSAGASSTPVTLTILPTEVNDPPEFTIPATVSAVEDAGLVTVPNFMTAVRPGPLTALDEANQVLHVDVVGSAVTFTKMPAIDLATGTLTFQTAPDVNSLSGQSMVVTVTLTDGTTSDARSTTKTFTLDITPVNDEPLFTLPSTYTEVKEDNESVIGAAKTQIPGFATQISAGPLTALDEIAGQKLTFNRVSYTNPTLFSVAPTLTADGTLEFVTAKDQNGDSVVVINLTDDGSSVAPNDNQSPNQTFTIHVKPVNDAPVVTLPATTSSSEDQGLVVVPNFASNLGPGPTTAVDEATQKFTVQVKALDPSAFIVPPTIAADGTLRYQTALDVNSNFANHDLRVQVYLEDTGVSGPLPDTNISPTQTFTILTSPVNDAPSFSLSSDFVPVNEDNEASQVPPIALTTIPSFAQLIKPGPDTADDEDTQGLRFDLTVSAPELFEVAPAISDTGVLTFKTASNKNGKAVVVVQLFDLGPTSSPSDVNASARQTFTISVTAVNDAPQFDVPAGLTVNEDQGLVTQSRFAYNVRRGPAGTDDENSQTIQFFPQAVDPSAFEIPPTIEVDGTLTFKTAANVNSSNHDLTVRVYMIDSGLNDPAPNANRSVEKTFSITVTPENDPPIADGYTVGGTEDVQMEILSADILVGDSPGPTSDEQGQQLSITQVERTTSLGGTITPVFNGSVITSLIYRPANNAVGPDKFLYVVTDNGSPARSGTGTVVIQLAPVNDPPQFTKGADQTVLEDAGTVSISKWATNILAGPASAVDEQANQTVNFQVVAANPALFETQPTIASDGTLSFKPARDAVGSTAITVVAVDNGSPSPASSAASTFSITITPVNDAPVFTAGATVTVSEDSGAYSQTWATGIKPAAGLLSTPPTAGDESSQLIDFILTADKPSLFAVAPSMTPEGLLSFTPAANAFGTALVTVVAKDRGPAGANDQNTSVTQTLTISITAVNDAPAAVSDTFTTDENSVLVVPAPGVLSNDTDVDLPADQLVVVPQTVTSTLGAAVTIGADGSISYDPAGVEAIQRLTNGQSATDSFVYQVRDAAGATSNLATVNIVVGGIDDPPKAVNDTFRVAVGQAQNLTILANDTDVDSLIDPRTIEIQSLPAFGTAVVDQTGLIHYTPGVGFRGTDTFSYTVRDAAGNVSNEALVSVVVDNAPRAGDDNAFTTKNQSVVIGVLANDTDPDGSVDSSTVEIVVPPAPGGTATVQPDGKILFTPATDFSGVAQFSYIVRDNVGTPSNVANVQVQVFQSKWQNPTLAMDVNDDGKISPIDALLVINYLNTGNPTNLPDTNVVAPPYFDVQGDEKVSPLDVLLIINYLNTHLSGEGEASGTVSAQLGAPLIVTMVTPEQMVATVGASVARDVEEALASELESCGAWVASEVPQAATERSSDQWSDEESLAALAELAQGRKLPGSPQDIDTFFEDL